MARLVQLTASPGSDGDALVIGAWAMPIVPVDGEALVADLCTRSDEARTELVTRAEVSVRQLTSARA